MIDALYSRRRALSGVEMELNTLLTNILLILRDPIDDTWPAVSCGKRPKANVTIAKSSIYTCGTL